jgi:hypothetical protein
LLSTALDGGETSSTGPDQQSASSLSHSIPATPQLSDDPPTTASSGLVSAADATDQTAEEPKIPQPSNSCGIDLVAIEQDPTTAYVSAKLELLTLARTGQSNSPRSTEMHETMDRASKAYLFDRKDAELAFRAHRGQSDGTAAVSHRDKHAEKVQKDASKPSDDTETKEMEAAPVEDVKPSIEETPSTDVKEDESGDESMLGALGATPSGCAT